MPHNTEMQTLALLYASGELAGQQRADFEAHLSTCAQCRAIIKTCAAVNAALPTLPAPAFVYPEPRQSFWAMHIAPLLSARRLLAAGAVAAAVVMLVFAAVQTQNAPGYMYQDGLYAQIDALEYEIDNLFADF